MNQKPKGKTTPKMALPRPASINQPQQIGQSSGLVPGQAITVNQHPIARKSKKG